MWFNHLRVAMESVLLILFRTSYNFCEWSVVPFELTSALAYFIDLMNRVLRDVLNKFMLVFIGDILVYFKTKEEHKRHLETLREHELKSKLSKCHFWRS